MLRRIVKPWRACMDATSEAKGIGDCRRIGQWGRALAALSLLLAVVLPSYGRGQYCWTMPAEAFLMGLRPFRCRGCRPDLTTGARLLSCGTLMMLAPLVLAYGTQSVYAESLSGFRSGPRVRSRCLCRHARLRCRTGILSVFVGIVAGAAASVAVSHGYRERKAPCPFAPGRRSCSRLGLAALFWTFAHVFAEAEALAEENRQFV